MLIELKQKSFQMYKLHKKKIWNKKAIFIKIIIRMGLVTHIV